VSHLRRPDGSRAGLSARATARAAGAAGAAGADAVGAPPPAATAVIASPPRSVVLPKAIHDAIVAHAITEAPNEMCGFVVGTGSPGDGGVALRWEPARNAAASPLRFDVAPEDLIRLFLDIDDRGEAIWAVVHSHVRSPAVPSAADIAGGGHPGALHLIVSLGEGEADGAVAASGGPSIAASGDAVAASGGPSTAASGGPSIRAWRISGGVAVEVVLEIER